MSAWGLATLALLPPFAMAALEASRGALSRRLVALQLANALAIMILILLTFFLDQPSFMDLPMTLALLGLPGTLLAVLFLERWL